MGDARFPRKPVAQLLGSNGPIHAVAYSASPGSYILTGSSDRTIRLYNPNSTSTTTTTSTNNINTKNTTPSDPGNVPQGRLIQTYSGHGHEVLSLSIAHDNATFASSGGDRAVYLWDVTTAQTIRRFGAFANGHTGRVNTVTFAGMDDSLLISGGHDTTVRIWDIKSGGSGSAKPIQILEDAKDAVTAVVVGHEEKEIVTGSVDGRVRTYDLRNGKCVTDVMPAAVICLSLSRDDKTLLVGTLDSRVRLMDRRDGGCLRTYGGKSGAEGEEEEESWRNEEFRVQSCFGGKERFVVAGEESLSSAGGENGGRVWAWDLTTGKVVARISVPVPGSPLQASSTGGSSTKSWRISGTAGHGKEKRNVISTIAWKEDGYGNQFCVGGTSGVVTVFGE
ncbi:WD40 repeat-like protein [Naviculisporaceae sp. PSN 640]